MTFTQKAKDKKIRGEEHSRQKTACPKAWKNTAATKDQEGSSTLCKETHTKEAEKKIMQKPLGHGVGFRFYAKRMVSRQEERLDLHFKISFTALGIRGRPEEQRDIFWISNQHLAVGLKAGSERKEWRMMSTTSNLRKMVVHFLKWSRAGRN